MSRATVVLLIALLAVLSVIGLVVTKQSLPTSSTQVSEQSVVIINMTVRSWRFDPVVVQGHSGVEAYSKSEDEFFADTIIKVRKGDTVVINIKNLEPNQPHGFGLEEFGVFAVIPPEQTVTVRFVATSEGSFTFFCTVFCGTGHPLHKGTLIVSGS